MILKRRLFEREEPSEEAKKIFIFCEGKKREKDYFDYFKDIDSRINIEVYELDGHEDNSPLGLYKIALLSIYGNEEMGVKPKYEARPSDQVWIVIDIDKDKFDSRSPQIDLINKRIRERTNWSLAKSNPCFEVWLYYHLLATLPVLDNENSCKAWKKKVNSVFQGGFDARKHPIYISTAIANSKANFDADEFSVGSTEVYLLGREIYKVLEEKIKPILKKMQG
jgi:hypothetical protein